MQRGASLQQLEVGGSNSVVESQPSKLLVAGSIPVSRSRNLGNLGLLRWGSNSRPSRLKEKKSSGN